MRLLGVAQTSRRDGVRETRLDRCLLEFERQPRRDVGMQVIAVLQGRVTRAYEHREAGASGPLLRGRRPELCNDGLLRRGELLLCLRRTRVRQRAVRGHRERPAVAIAGITDE